MKCLACNCFLEDHEAVRKDIHGKFIDMCDCCYSTIENEVLSMDSGSFTIEEFPENLGEEGE